MLTCPKFTTPLFCSVAFPQVCLPPLFSLPDENDVVRHDMACHRHAIACCIPRAAPYARRARVDLFWGHNAWCGPHVGGVRVCVRAPSQDIYEANDAASTYNHLVDAVVRTSFTREMYLGRLRTLTNNFLRTGQNPACSSSSYTEAYLAVSFSTPVAIDVASGGRAIVKPPLSPVLQ